MITQIFNQTHCVPHEKQFFISNKIQPKILLIVDSGPVHEFQQEY